MNSKKTFISALMTAAIGLSGASAMAQATGTDVSTTPATSSQTDNGLKVDQTRGYENVIPQGNSDMAEPTASQAVQQPSAANSSMQESPSREDVAQEAIRARAAGEVMDGEQASPQAEPLQ